MHSERVSCERPWNVALCDTTNTRLYRGTDRRLITASQKVMTVITTAGKLKVPQNAPTDVWTNVQAINWLSTQH